MSLIVSNEYITIVFLDLAQDVLFIRGVIQQYPEIYEDEIQEWI